MRFNLLTRRIMAPALGLALAATVAACSSSSSSSSTTSPSASSSSASAPASSSAPSTSATATGSAVAQITANWEKFFSSSTPDSEKTTLLENGSKFSSAITAMSQLPLASGIGAKVTKVVVTSPTQATVTYDITGNGSTLLANQTGTAVYQDGTWKVGDASLCALFKLVPGGSVPAACSSSG